MEHNPETTITEETVEQEIQRKGLTAPRVTPEQVEAEIVRTDYLVVGEAVHLVNSASGLTDGPPLPIGLGLLTICVLTLANGFTVTGESACASPENFNAEIGRRIARENAKTKVWPLLGFRLRDQLAAVNGRPYTARERAQLELDDLSAKIQKLEAFTGSAGVPAPAAFFDLDDQKRDLLTEQLGYMQAYHRVLLARLEVWNS